MNANEREWELLFL